MLSEKTRAVIDAWEAQFKDMDPLDAMQAQEAGRQEALKDLDPSIPPIAAIVIAGDIASAKRSEQWVEQGADAEEVLGFVGSYARLDFAVKMYEAGKLSEGYLLDNLPDLWRGSDPDDSDPRFLKLWTKARERHVYGQKKGQRTSYITDGKKLPKGPLMVYRGERGNPSYPTGIAWTTDLHIAEKFARTGGLRANTGPGTVFKARVPKDQVLAYLTGRGENEVIFDPAWLQRAGYWQPTPVEALDG